MPARKSKRQTFRDQVAELGYNPVPRRLRRFVLQRPDGSASCVDLGIPETIREGSAEEQRFILEGLRLMRDSMRG